VVGTYPNDVARYRSGEVKLKRFFVGEVMKASKGRADPKTINQLLEQHLAAADPRPQQQ
jgi:aspartyl-tRNA(Asn)/glutamyl-tRNA(Gln) amidotransferase subunit B